MSRQLLSKLVQLHFLISLKQPDMLSFPVGWENSCSAPWPIVDNAACWSHLFLRNSFFPSGGLGAGGRAPQRPCVIGGNSGASGPIHPTRCAHLAAVPRHHELRPRPGHQPFPHVHAAHARRGSGAAAAPERGGEARFIVNIVNLH